MFIQAKKQKLKPIPLPMPKRPLPIQISLNNDTLPEKIRQVVNEGKTDSNTCYDNALGM